MEISIVDLIDVSLVAILMYHIYKLIKGSIAIKIFFGMLALYFIYLIVQAMRMELLTSILGQFMGIGVLAMLILFQQEIRKFLVVIGKGTNMHQNPFIKPLAHWRTPQQVIFDTTEIMTAIRELQETKTGALIVFSIESELKFFVETGDFIDAIMSRGLLLSIFNKNTPLHDGAVILHKGRIRAARCVLPVSENTTLPSRYGLRHRSAIGMSEETSALVVVVSEETGGLFIAHHGKYLENMSLEQCEKKIVSYIHDNLNDILVD